MGYDVHITRVEEWSESDENPILLDEWFEYIKTDPELRLDGFAAAHLPDGGVLVARSPGLAVWTKWPGHEEPDNYAWIDCEDGRITVKNPDTDILKKMFKIAQHFNAIVQGDDGELYGSNGEQIAEEDA